jgi:hypothetical protein
MNSAEDYAAWMVNLRREKLPKDLKGLPIVYTSQALLPHAEIARWVESRVQAAVATATIGRAD